MKIIINKGPIIAPVSVEMLTKTAICKKPRASCTLPAFLRWKWGN